MGFAVPPTSARRSSAELRAAHRCGGPFRPRSIGGRPEDGLGFAESPAFRRSDSDRKAIERFFESPEVRPAACAGLPPRAADIDVSGFAIEARVDSCHETIPVQNRHHVVAELAMGRRCERLESIFEAESSAEPLPIPNDRIERAEDSKLVGPGLLVGPATRSGGGHGTSSSPVEIVQFGRLDLAAGRRIAAPGPCFVDTDGLPERRDLPRRGDAKSFDGRAARPSHQFLATRTPRSMLIGMHSFGKVIALLEAVSSLDGHASGSPEVFECGFGRAPIPPRGIARARCVFEIPRPNRSFVADPPQHTSQQGGSILSAESLVPPGAFGEPGAVCCEAMLPVGIEGDWDDARIVGPVFEECSIMFQEPFEGFGPVPLESGVEDQMMGTFQHVDRVDLYETESVDQRPHRRGATPERRGG